jgi:hypothetical protein
VVVVVVVVLVLAVPVVVALAEPVVVEAPVWATVLAVVFELPHAPRASAASAQMSRVTDLIA